jgi:hypothetical protein
MAAEQAMHGSNDARAITRNFIARSAVAVRD